MSLVIKNLIKSFGDKQIFSDFSYEFSDTGIYLLRGDSGVGKTTLLRIIAGLDNQFSGEVDGGGIPNVSFAFQEYRLFPDLSALDNVLLATESTSNETMSKARTILFEIGLSERDILLRPSELSGGMKQRVALARAFMKDAPILLLDEPTKELDRELCAIVRKKIKEISKSRLVLIVTHKSEDVDDFNATEIQI